MSGTSIGTSSRADRPRSLRTGVLRTGVRERERCLELSVEATLALLQQLQADGAIRRIAAVPNHYRLGYRHNGMTVWDVDDAEIARLGPLIGAQAFVSHCYRRPRQDGWRYNLFAMVHGRSAEEIDGYRAEIRALLGNACRADEMLVSSRILKKTGLRVGSRT